ncbi:hypothetical protein MPER_11938 [Moniliophthora perniciosa FA553]|nr:hypothetical protein MPER_11938 [Moniliophthora perniciosa FA553]
MSFNNSSGFSFKGRNTFNNLHGDQVNTTITAEIVNIHGHDTTATFTKNTIFEEFDYVKLGHVISMKDLGSVDLSQWDWHFQNGELVRRRARKTISTIQVHPNQQSKFTAIRYEGEDAQEAWEKISSSFPVPVFALPQHNI